MTELQNRVKSVRSAEAAVKGGAVAEQVEKVTGAADDVTAEPAVRELARMGPKVLPAIRSAEATAKGDAKVRLSRLVEELTPPDPVTARNQGPVVRQGQEED